MSSKGAGINTQLDETTLQEEELATHQEAIPIPYVAGTQLIALRWISDGIEVYAKESERETGKK